MLWCPPQSFDWYNKKGDVVIFDMTYEVNTYDMPCAIFAGVDKHENSILFDCALLRNETTSTFKWLMKVLFFLSFVHIYIVIMLSKFEIFLIIILMF